MPLSIKSFRRFEGGGRSRKKLLALSVCFVRMPLSVVKKLVWVSVGWPEGFVACFSNGCVLFSCIYAHN